MSMSKTWETTSGGEEAGTRGPGLRSQVLILEPGSCGVGHYTIQTDISCGESRGAAMVAITVGGSGLFWN